MTNTNCCTAPKLSNIAPNVTECETCGRVAVSAPLVGMGATVSYVTDRHAGTVIKVSKSGAKIVIREDRTTRTDDNGMSECQSYTFAPGAEGEGHEWTAHRCADGSYRTTGGQRVTLGVRSAYHDYSY